MKEYGSCHGVCFPLTPNRAKPCPQIGPAFLEIVFRAAGNLFLKMSVRLSAAPPEATGSSRDVTLLCEMHPLPWVEMIGHKEESWKGK